MGFDVVLYNRDGKKLNFLEITESLHNEIFNSKLIWRSYLELRKLSDYYLTDETFSGESLKNLISDLNNYKSLLVIMIKNLRLMKRDSFILEVKPLMKLYPRTKKKISSLWMKWYTLMPKRLIG